MSPISSICKTGSFRVVLFSEAPKQNRTLEEHFLMEEDVKKIPFISKTTVYTLD